MVRTSTSPGFAGCEEICDTFHVLAAEFESSDQSVSSRLIFPEKRCCLQMTALEID